MTKTLQIHERTLTQNSGSGVSIYSTVRPGPLSLYSWNGIYTYTNITILFLSANVPNTEIDIL